MSARSDDETRKSQEGSTPESSSEDELPRTSREFEQMDLNEPSTLNVAGRSAPIGGHIQPIPGQFADSENAGTSQQFPKESVDSIVAATHQVPEELEDSGVTGKEIFSEPMESGVAGASLQISSESLDSGVAGASLQISSESLDSGVAGASLQIKSESLDSGVAGASLQIGSESVDGGVAGTIQQVHSKPVKSGVEGKMQVLSKPVGSGVVGASQQIRLEFVDSGVAVKRQISEPVESAVAGTRQISEPVESAVAGTRQISEPVESGVAGSSQQICEESVNQTANAMSTPNTDGFIGTGSRVVRKDYPSAENVSQADSKSGPGTSYFESIPDECSSRNYKRDIDQIPSTSTDGRTFSSEETPLQTSTGDVREWDDGSLSSSDYQKYSVRDVASSFMYGCSYKQLRQFENDSTSSDVSEMQNQEVHRPDDEASQGSEQSLDELHDVEEQRVDSSDTTGSSGIPDASRRPSLQRDNNAANVAPRGHQAYLDALMEEAEQRGDQSTSSGIFSTDPEDQGMAQAQAWMAGVYAPRQREANQPAASPRHARGQASAQHLANITSSSDPDSAEDNRRSCVDLAKRNVLIDSEQPNKPDTPECTQDDTEEQRNRQSTSGCVQSREQRKMETERETSASPGPSHKRVTAASSLEERHAGNLTPKRAPPRKASSLKNFELERSASQSSYESVDPHSSSSGSFSRGHSEEKSSSEAPESSESTKLVTRRIWQKSGILQSMKNQTLSSHESIVDEEADIDESVNKVDPKGATANAQLPEQTGDGDLQIQQKDKMDDSIVQCSNEASSSKISRRSKKGRGSRKGKGGSKNTPKKKLQSPERASASTSQGTAAATDAASTSSTTKSIESATKPPCQEASDNMRNVSSSERKVEEDCPKEETTGGSIPEHGSRSPERSRSAPPERSPRNPKNRPDSCDF